MNIYLVGGAVRDALMGYSNADKDWVVVGATPQDLIFEGFTPVGKDFPVFLHPTSKEEYALARTERKTAPGYHGFVFHTEPSVTLEEDLARRDLTINAIAQDVNEALIDPFNGVRDIEQKILRHVSPAFSEDPVRVLRLARFAARFKDFTVAPETQALLGQMCASGEVDALAGERVWQEFAKGLMTASPGRMIDVLFECGALQRLFPNIQDSQVTPDARARLACQLAQASAYSAALSVRFAVLAFNLSLADDLKAPTECHDLAALFGANFAALHRAHELGASALLELFKRCDAMRRPTRFNDLLLALQCVQGDAPRGVQVAGSALENTGTVTHFLSYLHAAVLRVDQGGVAARAAQMGLVASQIGLALDQAREAALTLAISQFEHQSTKLTSPQTPAPE